MRIGLRIKQRREELKMSADELGRRLGKNRATIYRYENGEIENLPLDILEPIAEALETTPAYLMGWEEAEKKAEQLSDMFSGFYGDEELQSAVQALMRIKKNDPVNYNVALSVIRGFDK